MPPAKLSLADLRVQRVSALAARGTRAVRLSWSCSSRRSRANVFTWTCRTGRLVGRVSRSRLGPRLASAARWLELDENNVPRRCPQQAAEDAEEDASFATTEATRFVWRGEPGHVERGQQQPAVGRHALCSCEGSRDLERAVLEGPPAEVAELVAEVGDDLVAERLDRCRDSARTPLAINQLGCGLLLTGGGSVRPLPGLPIVSGWGAGDRRQRSSPPDAVIGAPLGWCRCSWRRWCRW